MTRSFSLLREGSHLTHILLRGAPFVRSKKMWCHWATTLHGHTDPSFSQHLLISGGLSLRRWKAPNVLFLFVYLCLRECRSRSVPGNSRMRISGVGRISGGRLRRLTLGTYGRSRVRFSKLGFRLERTAAHRYSLSGVSILRNWKAPTHCRARPR
jgi:hypothetical protein